MQDQEKKEKLIFAISIGVGFLIIVILMISLKPKPTKPVGDVISDDNNQAITLKDNNKYVTVRSIQIHPGTWILSGVVTVDNTSTYGGGFTGGKVRLTFGSHNVEAFTMFTHNAYSSTPIVKVLKVSEDTEILLEAAATVKLGTGTCKALSGSSLQAVRIAWQ